MSSINFNDNGDKSKAGVILLAFILFALSIILFVTLNSCTLNENTPVNDTGVFFLNLIYYVRK